MLLAIRLSGSRTGARLYDLLMAPLDRQHWLWRDGVTLLVTRGQEDGSVDPDSPHSRSGQPHPGTN
jgi:hypothetical protein